MSGFGPVSVGRSPVFVRLTTGAVSSCSCGFVLPLPFKCLRAGTRTKGIGATYMLPRGGRLRVCCCGQMALAALPRYAATFTWLLLSRQPRSRCWSRMLPTMKSHGPFWLPRPDPKKLSELRTTGTGVASTYSAVSGMIRNILRRSSKK